MIDPGHLTAMMKGRGIAQEADLIGVSDTEITHLEAYFGLQFPDTYKQFLRYCGRSAGLLSPWMAIYFDDLKEIREQFDGLLATHNTAFTLPKGALVIANWESVFDYVICDGQGDGPVYRVDLFQDLSPKARLYAARYSHYLENLVQTTDTNNLPSDLFEEDLMPMADDTIHY